MRWFLIGSFLTFIGFAGYYEYMVHWKNALTVEYVHIKPDSLHRGETAKVFFRARLNKSCPEREIVQTLVDEYDNFVVVGQHLGKIGAPGPSIMKDIESSFTVPAHIKPGVYTYRVKSISICEPFSHEDIYIYRNGIVLIK